MNDLTLASLQPGDTARVADINADEALHYRLLALGFRKGKRIELIRRAKFSGPLQVRIGTTDILMRISEANHILVSKE